MNPLRDDPVIKAHARVKQAEQALKHTPGPRTALNLQRAKRDRDATTKLSVVK